MTEKNTVTIYLDGRIDTNNAAQTEKEIFDAIGDNTNPNPQSSLDK